MQPRSSALSWRICWLAFVLQLAVVEAVKAAILTIIDETSQYLSIRLDEYSREGKIHNLKNTISFQIKLNMH